MTGQPDHVDQFAADRKELDRQRRLVDQMATMQASLRDRYHRQAVALRLCQLTGSVVATAFAFASTDVTVMIGPVTAARGTVLGWLAVAILVATVVDLVLDRGGAASQREAAVQQLFSLKTGYRADPEPHDMHAEKRRMTQLYATTMESVPPISERDFNRLKAKHLRKVAVSKYLSAHPGASVHRTRRAVRRASDDRSPGRES